MSKGRTKYFWISLFFIHVCFLGWQIQHGNWLLVDSHDYIWAAKNLKSSGTLYCDDMEELPLYDGNYTRRPPMYPAFLASAMLLTQSFVLPAILQMACSLLSFFLFCKIFSLLYPGKILPRWLLVFLSLYPAQYIYTNLIMAESLFQLFLMAGVYFFLLGIAGKRWKPYLWYSIFLVFAILTKPVLYLIVPLHLVYVGYSFWKTKRISFLDRKSVV